MTALRSLAVASVLELVVFPYSLPPDSTQPETGLRLLAAYSQTPGLVASLKASDVLHLPFWPTALIGFLIEAVMFALPIWLIGRWWERYRVARMRSPAG